MIQKQTTGSFCAALALGACASPELRTDDTEIFRAPQNYVGQQVGLCGYIRDTFEDRNIWANQHAVDEDGDLGLGFISNRALEAPGPWHNQTRCVTGEIVRTGCAQESICSWSNFPYALRVSIDAT